MESGTSTQRSKLFRYVVPAMAALLLLGGCSQNRATVSVNRHASLTMSRHDPTAPSRAMPDFDSALGASDSLGSQIFAEVRPRLTQAQMVYRMAAADDPNLQMQSFYSPEVRVARVPKQIIVSGRGGAPLLDTAAPPLPTPSARIGSASC